jgi:hypothetical protein
LACHLQIDANPDPDPAYHFDAENRIRIHLIILARIRILPFNLMRIHADPDPQHWLQISQMTKILINAIMIGTFVAIGIVYFLDLHDELPS